MLGINVVSKQSEDMWEDTLTVAHVLSMKRNVVFSNISNIIRAVIKPSFSFYMSLKCGHTIVDFPDQCVRICPRCCASLCRCDLLVILLKLMFRIIFSFYTRSAKFVDMHLYFSLAATNFPRSLRSQISQISLSSLVPLSWISLSHSLFIPLFSGSVWVWFGSYVIFFSSFLQIGSCVVTHV